MRGDVHACLLEALMTEICHSKMQRCKIAEWKRVDLSEQVFFMHLKVRYESFAELQS